MTRLNDRFIRLFSRVLLSVHRRTRGRIGARLWRWDVLLLTTTGRRSGLPRTTTLVYLKDGDRLLVVASNGGEQMPAWFRSSKHCWSPSR